MPSDKSRFALHVLLAVSVNYRSSPEIVFACDELLRDVRPSDGMTSAMGAVKSSGWEESARTCDRSVESSTSCARRIVLSDVRTLAVASSGALEGTHAKPTLAPASDDHRPGQFTQPASLRALL